MKRETMDFIVILVVALAGGPRAARADTAVGDAGHYLMQHPVVFLHNPTGRAFSFTLHRFQWWIGAGWNQPKLRFKLLGPDGATVLAQTVEVNDDGAAVPVPAGARGTYRLELDSANTLNYLYLTSDLDRAVLWTGPPDVEVNNSQCLMLQPFVPRRWYFWVPPDAKRVTLRAQNNVGRSQREDHGLTVYSPRGQRLAVLWGQANADAPTTTLGKAEKRLQQADILVEPGSAGRFWSIEVRLGDSHPYSDINFTLQGVPPYVARSPEEWFDPTTGQPAAVPAYDESEYVQSDRTPAGKARDPLLQHWTPCPALGDPDGDELRGPAAWALWNPEGRTLKFVIGTYLPRGMSAAGRRGPQPDDELDHAALRVLGADGKELLATRAPLRHLHEQPGEAKMLETGRGVARFVATEAEHFWTYTYPGTPAVLVGAATPDGWRRFAFDLGTARDWFFFVPRGTRAFRVRVAAADATDQVVLEVHAPDRQLGGLYGNAGEQAVTVPAGLDGRLWRARFDVGGGTTLVTRLPRPRFPSLALTFDLQGVPGYLAPTWEQWFDPAAPVPANDRATPATGKDRP